MASIRQRGKTFQARVIRKGQAPLARTFTNREDAEKWAGAMETMIAMGAHRAAPTPAAIPAAPSGRPPQRLGSLADDWYKVEGGKLRDARNNASRIRKLFGETVDPRKPDNRCRETCTSTI